MGSHWRVPGAYHRHCSVVRGSQGARGQPQGCSSAQGGVGLWCTSLALQCGEKGTSGQLSGCDVSDVTFMTFDQLTSGLVWGGLWFHHIAPYYFCPPHTQQGVPQQEDGAAECRITEI